MKLSDLRQSQSPSPVSLECNKYQTVSALIWSTSGSLYRHNMYTTIRDALLKMYEDLAWNTTVVSIYRPTKRRSSSSLHDNRTF